MQENALQMESVNNGKKEVCGEVEGVRTAHAQVLELRAR